MTEEQATSYVKKVNRTAYLTLASSQAPSSGEERRREPGIICRGNFST